jgi:hypothetical protein
VQGADTSNEVQSDLWYSTFAGPGDIDTVDCDPLYYYQAGQPFSAGCTGTAALMSDHNGQCHAWVSFYLNCMDLHGLGGNATCVSVSPNPNVHPEDEGLAVHNWNKYNTGSQPSPYRWRIVSDNHNEYFEMVPLPPSGDFGDKTSTAGVPGQNTPTPAEKIFLRHFLVMFDNPRGANFKDPSYGVDYLDLNDMEVNALDSMWGHGSDINGEAYRVDMRDPLGDGALHWTYHHH